MVRLRVLLAYEGTDFSGWGVQPDQPSVQAEVEAAFATLMRVPVRVVVAGRTDAGVHAQGQVFHADVPDVRGADPGLLRRLNGLLPSSIRVRRVEEAPAGFDARFSALWRQYRYRVVDAVPDPLRRRDTLFHPRPLDVDRLQRASVALIGLHDFAAFCKPRAGATTIRTLQRLDWERGQDGVIVGTVQADAFCHSMVRSLVGSLLPVGDGRDPVEGPASMLDARVRGPRRTVAPARGLTLVQVEYPPDDEVALRATQTRVRRLLPGESPGCEDCG